MERYIVDRLEGNFAVCETQSKKIVDINLDDFGFKVNPGDIILLKDGVYTLDYLSSNDLRKKNFDLQNSLFD